MMKKNKKFFSLCMIMVLVFAAVAGCSNQDEGQGSQSAEGNEPGYPEKTIQMIVPYKAGGDTDLNSRILAKHLQKPLGESVVVVNMEGGGGSVAARNVKDAEPDGYTVLFWHSSMLLNELKGITDFSYEAYEIAAIHVVSDVGVWVVNSKSSYNSIQDVVTELNNNPESITYASAVGNYSHLQAIAFEESTGTKLKKVDLGGTSNNIAALLGEQVDIVPIEYGLAKDYIASGDFKVLGAVMDTRSSLLPDVPTFSEEGIDMTKGFEKFYFVAFPKGTPQEIMDVFNAAVADVMDNEEAVAEFGNLMFAPKKLYGQDAVDLIKEKDEIYKTFKDKLLNDKF